MIFFRALSISYLVKLLLLSKSFTTAKCRETVAWGREIFGGNGLSIDYNIGRFFTDADGQNGARVVLLNEILARSLWPNQDPIGRQIKWGGPEAPTPWMTVVGGKVVRPRASR